MALTAEQFQGDKNHNTNMLKILDLHKQCWKWDNHTNDNENLKKKDVFSICWAFPVQQTKDQKLPTAHRES